MKTTALMLLSLLGSSAIAQKITEKNVPSVVKNAFQKKYPSVTKVKWNAEGDKFEAEFDQGTETSVVLDASGNILETEVAIKKQSLPKEVLGYVEANFAGKTITEIAKITDAKGTVTYEVELKGEQQELIFDANGKLISQVKDVE